MMLNIVAVTLLAATGVQAQVLALQKEDYCFAAAKCYEKNSGKALIPESSLLELISVLACATQYCSGPPGISACTVAGPFPFVPFNIPVRNQCCLTSNPYACYQAWAASHSGQTVDGSVVTRYVCNYTFDFFSCLMSILVRSLQSRPNSLL